MVGRGVRGSSISGGSTRRIAQNPPIAVAADAINRTRYPSPRPLAMSTPCRGSHDDPISAKCHGCRRPSSSIHRRPEPLLRMSAWATWSPPGAPRPTQGPSPPRTSSWRCPGRSPPPVRHRSLHSMTVTRAGGSDRRACGPGRPGAPRRGRWPNRRMSNSQTWLPRDLLRSRSGLRSCRRRRPSLRVGNPRSRSNLGNTYRRPGRAKPLAAELLKRTPTTAHRTVPLPGGTATDPSEVLLGLNISPTTCVRRPTRARTGPGRWRVCSHPGRSPRSATARFPSRGGFAHTSRALPDAVGRPVVSLVPPLSCSPMSARWTRWYVCRGGSQQAATARVA